MKKSLLTLMIAAGAFCIQSCTSNNKGADDTVEHAMDQNEEMADRQGTTGANMNTDDVSDFAVKAADSGLAEVSAGKVAQQKAQNQSVKDFAAMMIQDHTKSNEELKSIAAGKNITLPTAPGEDHQEKIADLNSLTGADFDKEYMGMMVDDHQKAVDLFEDAAENNEDAELKAFAAKNLPALQKHLEEAKALEESLQ
jgi:putative membrane protein